MKNFLFGSLLLVLSFTFPIFFVNDLENNKNVIEIKELKNEYTYVGKAEQDNYHYFRNKDNLVKQYYIKPESNFELIIDNTVIVYKVTYNFDNSNLFFRWLYDKILTENESGNYDTITFHYPS